MIEPSLTTLLDETQGVVGAVLGTVRGELRGVVGEVADGDGGAASLAGLVAALSAIGAALGFGDPGVTSVRAPTAVRVLTRRAGAILAIELDPRCAAGSLEVKLQTLAWTPEDILRIALQRRPARRRAELPVVRDAERRRTTPGTAIAGPVFTGALDEFGIPDLLEFLRNSQRTGVLTCSTAGGTGTVQLSRGMIVSASSPHALDLRAELLACPDLGDAQRRAVADLPAEAFRDDAIDSAVSHDLIATAALDRARAAHIHSAVREMIGWTSGRFSFDPGAPVLASTALRLSSQSILLKIYQEQDEPAPQT